MSAADQQLITELIRERDALDALVNDLTGRMVAAEAERDQFRSQAALFQRGVVEAEQARDEAVAQIDAHLNLCGAAPMTTVDEDGRAWRLSAHGAWLTKRNPDGSLHCNHSDREFCTRDHDTEITYRLVPIEDAPSEGEGE